MLLTSIKGHNERSKHLDSLVRAYLLHGGFVTKNLGEKRRSLIHIYMSVSVFVHGSPIEAQRVILSDALRSDVVARGEGNSAQKCDEQSEEDSFHLFHRLHKQTQSTGVREGDCGRRRSVVGGGRVQKNMRGGGIRTRDLPAASAQTLDQPTPSRPQHVVKLKQLYGVVDPRSAGE